MAASLIRIMQALALLFLFAHAPSPAQTDQDQADPSVVEQELTDPRPKDQPPAPRPTISSEAASSIALSSPILVGAIRVEGAQMFPSSAFAPVVERYAGQRLTPEQVRQLVTEIADVARSSGYGLATAWVPTQRVSAGVLRVRIDEGRIDAIEASGPAAAPVERSLGTLVGQGPVSTRMLERQLLLAGDIAGVSVRDARLERRGERNVLLVRANRGDVSARAYLDNWGSDEIGPVRLRLVADFNGLIADDDRLTIGGVVTPFEPDEFWLVRGAYSKSIGTGGTKAGLNAYYARSNPGGSLSRRDYDGESFEIDAEVSHPLLRSRATSLWAEAGLGVRRSRQERDGTRIRDDHTTTASLALNGFTRSDVGRLRGEVRFTRGLDLLDATSEGDPLASRRDGSAIFSKLSFWSEYERALGSGMALRLAAEGQLADRALLSAEEMGLGGRYFLRGYDYRELSGDQGIAGSAELRYIFDLLPRPVRASELYLYGDAGSVGNLDGGNGGGSLASAGGGFRVDLGDLEAGVELGIPLSDTLDGDRPDPRLSFTSGVRF